MKNIILSFTTNGSGVATVTGERAILGKLYAIEYKRGTAATGADLTLTCNGPNGSSKSLLTIVNAGTADLWWYPRDLVHAVANAAALTGSSGGDRAEPIVQGVPYLAVAQGGDTLSGKIIIYYEDTVKETFLTLNTHASLGTASTNDTSAILGKLYAVEYQPGTGSTQIATGATLTLTCKGPNGTSKALLTKASAGTSDSWYYPRDLVHELTDGTALTGSAGGDRACPILQGVVNAAIADGGNSKIGYVAIYYED